MKKIKNLYRTGLNDEVFQGSTIASNWGLLKVITEEETAQQVGSIILSAGAVENKTGVLFFQLVNAGGKFREVWNAKDGDLFLLSHLAGDRLEDYVFVESEDVLLKYGPNVFEE